MYPGKSVFLLSTLPRAALCWTGRQRGISISVRTIASAGLVGQRYKDKLLFFLSRLIMIKL